MSQFVFVRHGQARPFERDGDRLSPLGERQARNLGAHLRSVGFVPTQVVSGPLRRQRETAALALAGHPGPVPVTDDRLAEYDWPGVLHTLAPRLAERDAAFAALLQRFEREPDGPARDRLAQATFEPLTDAWQRGEVQDPGVEPWSAFRARVTAALGELWAGPPQRRVLVVTSAGVIGLAVAQVLSAPDERALALHWRVHNASLTHFSDEAGPLGLDRFNETQYLVGGSGAEVDR